MAELTNPLFEISLVIGQNQKDGCDMASCLILVMLIASV
jgi:hypothetical protein